MIGEYVGDAERAYRLIEEHGVDLGLFGFRTDKGLEWRVYVCTKIGEWIPDTTYPCAWIESSEREIAAEIVGRQDTSPKAKKDAVQDQAAYSRRPAQERVLAEIAPVLANMLAEGVESATSVTRAHAEDLDADPRYLGCLNGIVDLYTGRIVPRADARKHLVTRHVPVSYKPGARHAAVDKLLSHLPEDVSEFLWNALGRSLHGMPPKFVFVLMGVGDSGKTTLLLAVNAALGGEAGGLPEAALRRTRMDARGPTPEREPFATKRLLSAEETAGWSIDKEKAKAASGGPQPWAYQPKYMPEMVGRLRATMWMASNDQVPRFGLTDKQMLRRLVVIPYVKPEELDESVMDAFAKGGDSRAAQAMLARLIEAASRNKPGTGMPLPDVIREASERAAEDERSDFEQFLAERVELCEGSSFAFDNLWRTWAVFNKYELEAALPDEIGGIKKRSAQRVLTEHVSPTRADKPVNDRHLGKKVRPYRGWTIVDSVDELLL